MPVRPSHDFCGRVHELWDELTDFEAGDIDGALVHWMRVLGGLIECSNVTWVGYVRIDANAGDPVFGWRPRVMRLLHPATAVDDSMKRGRARLNDGRADATTIEAWKLAGRFRVLRLCDVAPAGWFDSDYYCDHFQSRGIDDGVFAYFPINANAESMFGLFRSAGMSRFSELEREQLAYALRGIKWFHRRLLLANGLLVASKPITPTEHKVLHLLLKGDSEKVIADGLGQTYSTTHEHVANIYRKFGINSRSELMAIWLGKQLERQPPE